MSYRIFDDEGVLVEYADDTRHAIYRYDQGVESLLRAYTPEEVAAADAAALDFTLLQNESSLWDRARNAIAGNKSEITRLESFAAGTGSLSNTQRDTAIRQAAANQARIFRQLNALIKIGTRDLLDMDGT